MKYKKEWFDDECKEAIEVRRQERLRLLQCYSKEREEQYKKARDFAHDICRKKKRENQRKKIEEIEVAHNKKNFKKFYKDLRQQKQGYRLQSVAIRNKKGELCIDKKERLESWVQHFEEILTAEQTLNQAQPFQHTYEVENRTENPTEEEIQEIINEMKNGKSPGSDNIEVELIKEAGKGFTTRVYNLITDIWRKKNARRLV